MAIAIGGNSINKAYLGTTEIQKMYLGTDFVFDNTVVPSNLTPIMTNFRIEDANKNRVYFDTPLGSVAGINLTGFVMSNKNITAVDTTNNYFTVDSDYNAWDNGTIRLGEIGDVGESQTVLHDFSLEHIENKIPILTSDFEKFVTNTGTGIGTEGDPMGMQAALTESADNTTYWIKAADYGAVNLTTGRTASSTAPAKFIGYKLEPGDIDSNYYDYGVAWDTTAMPSFTGFNVDTGDEGDRALFVSNNNLIFKNIQISQAGRGIEGSTSVSNIIFENINVKDIGSLTNINLSWDFLGATSSSNVRLISCVSENAGEGLFCFSGSRHLIKDCKGYDDGDDITQNSVDYFMQIQRAYDCIITGCELNRKNAAGQNAHAYNTKKNAEHNLFYNNLSVNIENAFAARTEGSKYNVFKDGYSDGEQDPETWNKECLVTIYAGASYNLFENLTGKGLLRGFYFINNGEDLDGVDGTRIASDNIFKNLIIDGCIDAIDIKIGSGQDPNSDFTNNKFQNITFRNITDWMFEIGSNILPENFTGNTFTNCILDTVDNYYNSPTFQDPTNGFTFEHNNFHSANESDWSNVPQSGWGNSSNDNPDYIDLVEYIPQAEGMKAPLIDGVYYDHLGYERSVVETTIGGSMLLSERDEEPPVVVADFYVSNSTGLDTNPGTEDLPWKTMGRIQTEQDTLSGKTVALKRGDRWEERLYLYNQTYASQLKIVAYGDVLAELPIIDATREWQNVLTWTEVATNIWEETTLDRGVYRMEFDGTEVLSINSYDELGTSVPDFVKFGWSNERTATYHLYIHSTDNPNNYTMRFSSHNTANSDSYVQGEAIRLVNVDNITFNGIKTKGGINQAVNILDCKDITFDGVDVGELSHNGISADYYNSVDNERINVINSNIDANYTLDFGSQTVTEFTGLSGDGVYIKNSDAGLIDKNTVKNWSHIGVVTVSRHQAAVTQNIKISNNIISAPDLSYGGGISTSLDSDNIEVFNNWIEDAAGWSSVGGHNCHWHDNIFKDTKTTTIKSYDTGYGIVFQGTLESYMESGAMNYDVDGNIIENNVFISNVSGAVKISGNNYDQLVAGNIIRNNIAYECGTNQSNFSFGIDTPTVADSNDGNTWQNNDAYSSSAVNTFNYYNVFMDVLAFNGNNGNDGHTITNNIAADPEFLGVDDFRISDSSPCVNTGTVANINTPTPDYFGNARPFETTNVDIGINETTVTGTVKPANDIFPDGNAASKYNSAAVVSPWSPFNNTTTPEIDGGDVLQMIHIDNAGASGNTSIDLPITIGKTYTVKFQGIALSGSPQRSRSYVWEGLTDSPALDDLIFNETWTDLEWVSVATATTLKIRVYPSIDRVAGQTCQVRNFEVLETT